MKKISFAFLFTLCFFQGFSQTEDALSPEKKARRSITQMTDKSVQQIKPADYKKALEEITNLAVSRTPYVTIKQLRQGKADTASAVYVNESGKSGLFRYNRQDVSSPDDSVMTITVGKKRYVRDYDGYINVKWFGAKGDGVTDDTKAIQRAIDYLNPANVAVYKFDQSDRTGGTIFFPAGRFRVTNTIWLSNSVTLLGNTGPSQYSKSYEANPTSSIIVGDFNENKFIIQTQSIRKSGKRVAYDEATAWADSDQKNLSITSGCHVKGLVITTAGKGAFGAIRFCSTTYSSIENCGIYNTNVGIVIDDGLFVKVSDIHMAVVTAGIIAGPHNNSVAFNQIYINSYNKKPFGDLKIAIPSYAKFNSYEGFNQKLAYSDSKQATAMLLIGCLNTSVNSITFEGWDLGLVIKDSEADLSSLYFEGITDTCIPMTHCQVVTGNIFATSVESLFGVNEAVHLTSFFTQSRYASFKSLFKGYNPEKDPVPKYSKLLTRDSFLTSDDVNPDFLKQGKKDAPKVETSPNSAKAVGKTYSQEEVQAILLELRDLKAKLKAANILN